MIPLTLIVATTPSLGIGLRGALPWPQLKGEMAYFARVTKRAPSPRHVNAVVMGRRTWESMPRKFRPLRGRVNVVLTRKREGVVADEEKGGGGKGVGVEGPLVAGSIQEAMERLKTGRIGVGEAGYGVEEEGRRQDGLELGKVFVIGGAELYAKALETESARRILLTRVQQDFKCDVFFPLKLAERQGGGLEAAKQGDGSRWVKSSKQALDEWTGEEVPAGVQSDNGVNWEFEMWERELPGLDGG